MLYISIMKCKFLPANSKLQKFHSRMLPVHTVYSNLPAVYISVKQTERLREKQGERFSICQRQSGRLYTLMCSTTHLTYIHVSNVQIDTSLAKTWRELTLACDMCGIECAWITCSCVTLVRILCGIYHHDVLNVHSYIVGTVCKLLTSIAGFILCTYVCQLISVIYTFIFMGQTNDVINEEFIYSLSVCLTLFIAISQPILNR